LLAGGFDFVIEKGTQGATGLDPTYAPRIEAARRAGVLVPLMYHVVNSSPVDAQIKNALSHARDYDLDIAVDFEVEGTGIDTVLPIAEAIFQERGKCVLYSYPNFMKKFKVSQIDLITRLARATQYWSASYGDQKHLPAEDAKPFIPWMYDG